MAKTKISEFNSNPALNTDIDSINIAEGCAPSGINDAIRELMAQLKDWQAGTSNDPMVIGSSGSLTLNQGTANGVAYLNGSKVVTSGSALTFDGTNLGAGGATTPSAPVDIQANSGGTGIRIRGRASANAGSLRFFANDNTTQRARFESNDTSFEINSVANLPITFLTNDTEGMRLTSTGLGIGTSSPAYKLDVVAASNSANTIAVRNTDTSTANYSTQAYFRIDVAGNHIGGLKSTAKSLGGLSTQALFLTTAGAYPIAFGVNDSATPSMVLDSSGSLGLGVTPSAWASSYKAFQIGASSAFYAHGGVTSMHVTNNSYEDSGGVKYKVTGAAADYQQSGGVHYWYTAPSGTAGNAITFTQALTLDASGNLLVGTTSQVGTSRISAYKNATGYMLGLNAGQASSGSTYYQVEFYSAGNFSGSITSTTSSVAYNTSSDYRLKNSIAPMTGALAKVALLKPCTYKWNADGSDGEGFIAHELAEVVPQCVTGEKDAVDENGNPKYQGIDTSFLVATLTAAIQELKAEFDAYKASHP